MTKALAHNGQTIIDCVINRDERVLPMIAAGDDIRNIVAD